MFSQPVKITDVLRERPFKLKGWGLWIFPKQKYYDLEGKEDQRESLVENSKG